MEKNMTKVSIQSLLDAGAHFGHQTRRWNPKMKPYIFGHRGDIYIIDLKQTLIGLDQAYTFASETAKKGGTVLFVGTKKQAQEPIADAANRCGMPYVNARWLGGMLTNFQTIRSRVARMEELEAMDTDGRMASLPKKEQILLHKELAKLQANLNGIRNMKRTPDAVFVIDTNREGIAIHECKRLGIPVIGTLDTNCDPDDVEFGIPANDDAIRSVRLLADFVADAVIAGTGAPVTAAEMDTLLNKKSGLIGICGKSDRRDVQAAAKAGDRNAQLGIDMEIHRIKKYIGAYAALLGRVDAVVFTAGVGEMGDHIRKGALSGLENFGIKLDEKKNALSHCRNTETCISTDDSPVKIFVIPTDEELVMTEDAFALMNGTYDIHTNFHYTFESPDYVNKARARGLVENLKKTPELESIIAHPVRK